jgi:hypothetical protein
MTVKNVCQPSRDTVRPFSSTTPNAGSSKLSQPKYLLTEGQLASAYPSSTPKSPQRQFVCFDTPSTEAGNAERATHWLEMPIGLEMRNGLEMQRWALPAPKSEAMDHVRGCAPAGFERMRSTSLSPNRDKPLRFERVSSRSASPPRRNVQQHPTIFDFLYVA